MPRFVFERKDGRRISLGSGNAEFDPLEFANQLDNGWCVSATIDPETRNECPIQDGLTIEERAAKHLAALAEVRLSRRQARLARGEREVPAVVVVPHRVYHEFADCYDGCLTVFGYFHGVDDGMVSAQENEDDYQYRYETCQECGEPLDWSAFDA